MDEEEEIDGSEAKTTAFHLQKQNDLLERLALCLARGGHRRNCIQSPRTECAMEKAEVLYHEASPGEAFGERAVWVQ